jgi:DNA mismatch endonuclease (patch repair protein)
MTDVFSARKRSAIMAHVRGRGNERTELALLRVLRRHNITGWRRHQRVFGNPDFIFQKLRLAVFVDGCFWHCCPQHSTKPASNRLFWRQKLARNKARDRLVNSTLRKMGWTVLRIWQHELTRKNQHRCISRIRKAFASTAKKNAVRRQVSRL